ncbi:hypothetical protein [Rubellimicrobium roseum]|uniref:Uncharacterized protein n=1 Tax=Rubellimicrobium roseum TaxID=687525 RepID=A0A5C4N469_9RHOB|nr:hypothetical protein [Rubellimicrobium roseum]TNC61995.1 hypothetical protein FHG71_20630 [Rubellimicrobium roseum]
MADRRQGTSETDKGGARTASQGRDARLKAALKANIARRKARALAQGAPDDAGRNSMGDTPPDPPKED